MQPKYDYQLKYGFDPRERGSANNGSWSFNFGGGGGQANYEDILNMFHNRTSPRGSPKVIIDKNIANFKARIPLNIAILGGEISLNFSRKNICTTCKGTRRNSCSKCNGSGRKENKLCMDCHGLGYTKLCTSCGGQGFYAEYVETKVRIPTKIKSGTRLKIANQGNKVFDANDNLIQGDVIFPIIYPTNTIYSSPKDNVDIKQINVNIFQGNILCDFQLDINDFLSQKEITIDYLGSKDITLKLDLGKSEYVFEKEGFEDKDLVFIPNLNIVQKEFSEEEKNKLEELQKITEELYGKK